MVPATFLLAQWTELEQLELPVGTGGGITYGSGYVWAVTGNLGCEFYAYDVAAGNWINDLEDLPEDIYYHGAITYETGQSRRVFVATKVEDEDDQLFVYTKDYSSGSEGEWNDLDDIKLPCWCFAGFSLAFQPTPNTGQYPISGWLYLLSGVSLYRRAFDVLDENPIGFYPPNDSHITQNSLIFDWKPVNEAVMYQLQIDSSPFFVSPLFDTLIIRSEFNPANLQLEDSIYYWRLRFKKNSRRLIWSKWNQPMKFILANSGRPIVGYSYPPNNSILAKANLVIDWAPIGRMTSYRIQVDDDSLFSTPMLDAIGDMSEYQIEIPNGKYWWRVKFKLHNGKWNVWSRSNSFEVQEGWQQLDQIPIFVMAGGAMCYNNILGAESLYAFVGGGRYDFYCYSINTNRWFPVDGSLLPQNDGSSLAPCDDGGSWIYAITGIDADRYLCYRVPQNDWITRYDLPTGLGVGASLASDTTGIDRLYLVVGGKKPNFYVKSWPDEEGAQSQLTPNTIHKSRILSYPDKLVFNLSTDVATSVKIQVYDLLGKRTKILHIENVSKGEHEVTWDKIDDYNRRISSGIYFIAIEKENKLERYKVIIR